jgi:uncharacterized membrane protein
MDFVPVRPARAVMCLVPLAAGAGAGAMANGIIGSALTTASPEARTLVDRMWFGARLAPQDAPDAALVNVTAILGAVILWLVAGAVARRGRPIIDVLVSQSWAFVPALSMLVMSAVENYGFFPLATAFGPHAIVFSVAGFFAVNAFIHASASAPLSDRPQSRKPVIAIAVAVLVYWATFSAMGTLQYRSLNISYTDTADWEQMLWNTMHGRFLMSSAFPHMFFGEHVQVIHLLLLPLYALFPSLVTLMIAKSAILASGALPVYLLAKRRMNSAWLAACLGIAYLSYPAMQYTDIEIAPNTFRPEVFSVTLLLWVIYFLDAGRLGWLAVMSALAVACKEEIALPIVMVGIVLVFRRRYLWGSGIALLAAAWFVGCVAWIMPHYRGGPSHIMKYYSDFGENATFGQMLWRMVSDPLHTLSVAFQMAKIDYLLMLIVPLGLRPLFSPKMLFIMLPSLATALLASRLPSFNIYWHYQIAIVPCMIAAAVYGVENCSGILMRVKSIAAGVDEGVKKRAVLIAFTTLVLVSSLVGNVLYAKSPMSLLFYNPNVETYWRSSYVSDYRSKLFFREVRPLVPVGARVSATEFLATYFAARRDDYIVPDEVGRMDFVVIDTKDPWLRKRLEEKSTTLEKVLQTPGYDRIYDNEGFIVLRKAAAGPA